MALVSVASVTIAAHFDGDTDGYHENGLQRPESTDEWVTYTVAASTWVASNSGEPSATTEVPVYPASTPLVK
jgi:hypothetical protein